jgi:hypothetical protein
MAKFNVGDRVYVDWFSGDQDYATVVKYNPSNDTYDVRLESGEIAHPKAKLLISANSRACNSRNPVVCNAMNGCAATNANAPMWINDYKNQLKRHLADLDLEATHTFTLLRDYGKAARDYAKDGAKNDDWRELEKIGSKFIPELRKAANIIQGLKREADAL